MAYLGSTPTTQSFIAGTDYFNGTGAQVAYTLSRSVNSVDDIEVIVNNVEQSPSTYTAAGTALTFSAAPSSGTSNIYVRYLSTTLTSIAPSQGSVSPDKLTTGAPYWNAAGNVGIGTSSIATGDKVNIDNGATSVSGAYSALTLKQGGAGENGGQLHLQNSYATAVSPNKYLRVVNSGEFQLVNSAYTALLFAVSESGTFQFNSGYGTVAPAYGCRAWVNFNGTGTVAIRASGNVSSITDNGTGAYTVNFTTAMSDANYAFNISRGVNPGMGFSAQQDDVSAPTTTGIRFVCVNAANTSLQDVERINVAIFR